MRIGREADTLVLRSGERIDGQVWDCVIKNWELRIKNGTGD